MTTLYLATSGGHLAELLALERTLPADPTGDNVWLTDRSSHTTAALRDREAIFVRYVRERNVVDVARCIPHAHRLLVDRPHRGAVELARRGPFTQLCRRHVSSLLRS